MCIFPSFLKELFIVVLKTVQFTLSIVSLLFALEIKKNSMLIRILGFNIIENMPNVSIQIKECNNGNWNEENK